MDGERLGSRLRRLGRSYARSRQVAADDREALLPVVVEAEAAGWSVRQIAEACEHEASTVQGWLIAAAGAGAGQEG